MLPRSEASRSRVVQLGLPVLTVVAKINNMLSVTDFALFIIRLRNPRSDIPDVNSTILT